MRIFLWLNPFWAGSSKVDVQKLWLITYDSMNYHYRVLGGKVDQAICDGLAL